MEGASFVRQFQGGVHQLDIGFPHHGRTVISTVKCMCSTINCIVLCVENGFVSMFDVFCLFSLLEPQDPMNCLLNPDDYEKGQSSTKTRC